MVCKDFSYFFNSIALIATLVCFAIFKVRFNLLSSAYMAQSGHGLDLLVEGLQVHALIESTLSGLCVWMAIS